MIKRKKPKRKPKFKRKKDTTKNLVLTFGKYKGRKIEDCPSSYLLFIAETFDNGPICYAADTEYQLREKFCEHFEEYE